MQSSSDTEARQLLVGRVASGAPDAPQSSQEAGTRFARGVRFLLGALLLFVAVGVLAHWLRPEVEAVGRAFVERFGLAGMVIGCFLADGFHFPVPPHFYMLLGIASKSDPLHTLSAIALGSLAGGTAGYFLAQRLSHVPWVARWLERASRVIARFGGDTGFRLILIASFTPIAYSALCYLAGLYRLPKRQYLVLAFIRIPKLVLYYYLVKLGWGIGLA